MFTSDLVFVRQIGSVGNGNGQLLYPWDVTHDEDENLYVTDGVNNCIQVFNVQGKFLRTLTTPGRIVQPFGITYSRNLVYITQWAKNGKVRVYHKNGGEVCSIPYYESGKQAVWGLTVGFIYVYDLDRHCVIIF